MPAQPPRYVNRTGFIEITAAPLAGSGIPADACAAVNGAGEVIIMITAQRPGAATGTRSCWGCAFCCRVCSICYGDAPGRPVGLRCRLPGALSLLCRG